MNQRTILGPLRYSNLANYLTWRNDPTTYRWCRQYQPLTEEEHRLWFEGLVGCQKRKMYEIVVPTIGPVGVCGLTDIDYINSRAEFSLYIAPAFRGNGYAGDALSNLCRHGFDVLNLNSIWGESFSGNPAERIFEEVGFKKTGTRPDFYFRDGSYIDANLFTIRRGQIKYGNPIYNSDGLVIAG